MHVDIIENTKALAELRANWDAVYDADPEAQFFLSWTWMSRWLAKLDKPWFVLAAKPDAESSAYVAFFPLWLQTKERKSGGFYNDLNMGGNHFADYTGFLCRPELQKQAIPAFAGRLKQLNWTHLHLEYFCASDQRAALFMQEFAKSDFDVTKLARFDESKMDLSICPVARLPGDWDEYLNRNLSANTRQKIRRLLRQLESSGEFRITHAEQDTLERDIEILLRFWVERFGKRKGARLPAILKKNRLMLQHCFAAGSLFLPVLWHGERPVCALAILVDASKKSFLFLIGGRDETFDGPPPGLLLHAHSIRHAIANGFVTYDFLRGNEPYKYSFGVEEHRIATLVLTTKDGKNLGGRLDRRSLPFALERSMKHHRAGRPVKAERGYWQVLDLEPDNANALYHLGRIVAKRGEHPAAIKLFKTLVAVRPDVHKAWLKLGTSLQARGAFAEAAAAYCEFIERQPATAGTYCDLGQVLVELGLFDLAVAAFEAARELRPDHPGIDAGLMKVLHARGGLSRKHLVRRASVHADVGDRAAKLSAIVAARKATSKLPVPPSDRASVEPPFALRKGSVGPAAQRPTDLQTDDALRIYHSAIARHFRQG